MNRFSLTLFGLLSVLPLVLADDDDDEPGLKGSPMERTNAHIAHGVVAGLAFAIFLPIGAILLRGINSPHAVLIHRIWQIVSLGIMLLGFALGLWLSYLHHEVYNEFHEWFGTFIILGCCVQPVFGVLHHNQYVKTQKKSWKSKTHVWFGRLLLVLGIINGGLGFQLAANTTMNQNVIYIIFVMLIALLYVGALIRWSTRGQAQIVSVDSVPRDSSQVEITGKEVDITVTEH